MKNLDRILYAVSWIINLFLVFAVFGSMDTADLKTYYSSDTLYLGSIYKDIFIDGTGFKGWYLNAAPNFFPDMFLYFIVNGMIPDFKIAYVVFSMIQYFIVLSLLNVLLRTVKQDIQTKFLTSVNLLFPIFLLCFLISDYYIYTYFIFSHSFHTGVFINFLLLLIILFKYLHSQKTLYVILGALISLLATYNDRLFLVLFTFPLLFALILNFIQIKSKPFMKFSVFILGFSFIGLVIYRLAENNEIFKCIGLDQKYMNLKNVISSFHNLINQHYIYIKEFRVQGLIAIIAVLNFFLLPYIIYRYFRNKKNNTHGKLEIIYLIFIFGSIFLTLFTPVINGYYLGTAHLRYNIFSFWLSVFNLVFFFYYWFKPFPKIIFGINGVLILLYSTILINLYSQINIYTGIKNVATHYPKKIEAIDEFAKNHHLQYGLSEYWGAKMTTMFSKQNLRVYTIANEELKPWYHVMNRNWYHEHNKGKYNSPVFNFVILDKLNPILLQENFGKAIDSLVYENETILYVIEDVKFTYEGKPFKVSQ